MNGAVEVSIGDGNNYVSLSNVNEILDKFQKGKE